MTSKEFHGKVALVTGASSGIGRETARMIARRGAKTVLCARRQSLLDELAEEIRNEGGEAAAIAGDLCREEDRRKVAGETLNRYETLDVLINAAGIIATGSVENTTLEDWDRMMTVNVTSIFHLTQLLLPELVKRKGNIVNVSSITGTRSFPGVLSYCVSKAAVDQFTRCTALDLGPKGVRVNAVNPGVVRTNLHRAGGMDEKSYGEFLERCKETHPLGRAGEPEEVAEMIAFLASDRARWITGETFAVDGGRAQTCAR